MGCDFLNLPVCFGLNSLCCKFKRRCLDRKRLHSCLNVYDSSQSTKFSLMCHIHSFLLTTAQNSLLQAGVKYGFHETQKSRLYILLNKRKYILCHYTRSQKWYSKYPTSRLPRAAGQVGTTLKWNIYCTPQFYCFLLILLATNFGNFGNF